MTLTHTQERIPAAERIAVRCVDSDVHPVPKRGELAQYIPEPWRSKYFLARKVGEQIYYDAPDYAHAYAMRMDTFPPDGEFPGSDPDMAFRQLIMEAGSDIAILEPGAPYPARIPEAQQAMSSRAERLAGQPLAGQPQQLAPALARFDLRGHRGPEGAAREIEKWAGHPYMAQILIKAEPRPSWGHPKYDPIWAAATKHDITVSCHLSRSHYEMLPMPPVGFPSYNHDFMVTYSLLAANQVMSLIFDGVFDRFPTLRIVFVEHAFSWILPLMWRMDAIYEARKSRMDIKRKPSEYVKDHIKFTTQPLDYPEDKTELTRALEWMECDKILLFSSDYPHWTFDDPRWLVKHLPKAARDAVMFNNGIATYHLPGDGPGPRGPGAGALSWPRRNQSGPPARPRPRACRCHRRRDPAGHAQAGADRASRRRRLQRQRHLLRHRELLPAPGRTAVLGARSRPHHRRRDAPRATPSWCAIWSTSTALGINGVSSSRPARPRSSRSGASAPIRSGSSATTSWCMA